MAGRVEGKVALVTGGASGIGRATALTFAREGAQLVIADMNEDGGQQTVHMIQENGGEATFVQVDVSQAIAVEAMISKAVETYGRLDCAHNNAGIGARPRAPLHECTEETWDRVLGINLKGVWLCMKYEIIQMLKQGGAALSIPPRLWGWWVPGRVQEPIMRASMALWGSRKQRRWNMPPPVSG